METKTNPPPTLVIRRVIPAKRDKVFAAWSKPELMSQWFRPPDGKAIVSNDFRVGGSYQNTMIFSSDPNGHKGCGADCTSSSRPHHGSYLEIVPPEKIVFTWNSQIVSNSRVTVELRERGESTELTLTHELLETEELRQQHSGGWDMCLSNLEKFFE
ncbi:MAG: SRPBCC domain-containing protein [Deltaproteobacteria bacterium]|nr:SRPBCC domain-containing protein [Deltaproteobacteria bacterium]